jgi:hypothetical protein
MDNLAKIALQNNGNIYPLIIPASFTNGTGLMNPSILYWKNKLIVNLRHVNYTLYHSELNKFEHMWGPLAYIHPENDMHLTTTNYIAELDEELNIIYYCKIDTSDFDNYEPQWEFIGLEDCRLVEWNSKLYVCGVRRDLDTKGTGRMEISELEFNDHSVKEIFRYRIPGPPPDNEYCMKNCTPILDKPFHLLKWTNPTCLMKFNIDGKDTELIHTTQYIDGYNDMRGGSQVIPYNNGYLTIIHETQLYNSEQGKKDATYRHRFVYWDKNFQNPKFSKLFSFMNMKIEFCCGLTEHKNNFLITFAASDNAAFILKIAKYTVEGLINE